MVIFVHLIQSASSLPTDASALESALSALERDIRGLESSSVPWEKSLPWFTALVALGVAIELWVIWRDRRNDVEAWRRGIIRSPERPSTRKFVVEIVGALVVTGGIVGELWVGIKITSINGNLRTKSAELRSKSDQLLALVTQQAGDAAQSAKAARQDAKAIREQLSDTSRIAAEALLKLREYVDTVAERQFDRRLDSKRFVELLKGKPNARVGVLYEPNDLEAWGLALDIYEWLGKGPSKVDVAAEWDVSPPEPVPPNVIRYGLTNAPLSVRLGASGSQSGIGFIAKDISPRPDSPLEVLGSALSASMLPSHRGSGWMSTEDKSLPDDLIIVVVGPKPSWLWGLQKLAEQKKNISPKTR